MNDSSRIEPLSVAESIPRQTPKLDFGDIVSQTLGTVVNQGAALVRGLVSALPMVSAAAAGTHALSSSLTAIPVAGSGTALPASVPSLGGLGSGLPTATPSAGLPSLQSAMQSLSGGNDLTSGQYLVLQQAIQQENQQYTAVSNILKVRSDSAKAAINNIR